MAGKGNMFQKRLEKHHDELRWLYMELYGNDDMFAELCSQLYEYSEQRSKQLKKMDESPRKKEETKSFEENMKRLEEIVSALERGDAALADSLALFEEGTRLATACSSMLDEAEQKVVKLQKGPDGEPVELPFDTEE